MATAQHIKALIQSHFSNEPERFTTLALQVAAHEAKKGHINLADDIRKLVDRGKIRQKVLKPVNQDLEGLILEISPVHKLANLIATDQLKTRISRILNEFRQRNKLKTHDLENRRKILLSGPPGTGKTMTASIIARELRLPLYVVLLDRMVTKFMGETSAKLRLVFDMISNRPGVYLFDEFDAIGGERAKDNDVGEMRRVLTALLQFIEADKSDSIIVAATNNVTLLDQALFRRFDDVLQYQIPTDAEIVELMKNRLAGFEVKFDLSRVVSLARGLSHAELTSACLDAMKETILDGGKAIETTLLEQMLQNRLEVYNNKR